MKLDVIEHIEKTGLEKLSFDRVEKMTEINKSFKTSLLPENGVYGVTEKITENGILIRRGINELGYKKTEFFKDGKLIETVEKINENTRQHIKYDDNGSAFVIEKTVRGDNPSRSISIIPNSTIERGNITVVTDNYGRPVLKKITDLELSTDNHPPLSSKFRDSSYIDGVDEMGHLIPHSFYGPGSKENIVPQTLEVNRSLIKKVENIARDLKKDGHKVDYEIKTNYDGKNQRPSSFEPKITVDGKEYVLDKSLQKIYNGKLDVKGRIITDVNERINQISTTTAPMREVGRKQGIEAATITCAISTVDNVILFIDGEVTADEMAVNIAKDTGTAGAVAYGSGFVSKGIAMSMNQSSNQLIQSLANSNVPVAVVSYGVATYGSVVDYAQGKIDLTELAYDMGNNAVGVTGSMMGAQYGAVVGQAAIPVPGVGAAAGALVGGMVGYAVASEAYCTAVEYGSKGAEVLADKAKQIGKATIEYAEENVPKEAASIKTAINDFASQNKLPFSFV